MTTTAVTPLSPAATMFTGTGVAPGNQPWTVRGFIYGSRISFTLRYQAPNMGYRVYAHGFIAGNGAVYGVARDTNGKTLRFRMPAGSALRVLHYQARVSYAKIWDHTARFGYTIPGSAPAGLAGLHIAMKAHDGGRGNTYDSISFGVNAPAAGYQITSGNIFVRH